MLTTQILFLKGSSRKSAGVGQSGAHAPEHSPFLERLHLLPFDFDFVVDTVGIRF
jgi:hypothetical protein